MNKEDFIKMYKNTKKEEIIEELFYKCTANYKLTNIIDELEKVLNVEVMLRYHGKDNAKENKIFNAGGMLYRDYIKDELKKLKEGK